MVDPKPRENRVLHHFDQCRLTHSGPSNLSSICDLQSKSTSLFGRKINSVDIPIPSASVGSLRYEETGETKGFDVIRYWKSDVVPSEMERLEQLLRYQEYISRLHAT